MLLAFPLNERLTLHARHVLKEAQDIARYTKSTTIEARHLLLALALEDGALGSLLLENIGFKKDTLGKWCLKKSAREKVTKNKSTAPLSLSAGTQAIIKRAFFIASEHHYPYVGTEHLTSALLESTDPFVVTLRETLAISPEKVHTAIESHLHFEQFPQMAKLFDIPEFSGSDGTGGSATPFLDQYTTDLAQEAKRHPCPVVGRDEVLERLMQILGRKEKRNALLIGDPGVGKTALVTALAEKIAEGQAGPPLRDKQIRSLDLALLVAGTSFRGEFETRIKELLKEIKQAGNIILFIDEIHTLVGTGNTQGGLDAANILKPSLARGDFQCIGATTFSEYKRHLEKDTALDRRFQTLLLDEPTPEEAVMILMAVAPTYEAHHQVTLPKTLLQEAVDLSVRFVHDRFLPDKALDLIDEASALVRRRGEKRRRTPTLIPKLETRYTALTQERQQLIERAQYDAAITLQTELDHIRKKLDQAVSSSSSGSLSSVQPTVTLTDLHTVLARMTHIPLERLTALRPADRLKHIQQTLAAQFIGQTTVRETVIHLLARSLAGVADLRRPVGSLLFLGPSGVGKTYLAQVLAREFFGDEQALIRLDMSEFMERHSVAQILGAPAGYVGYGDGGKLTEAVRRRPYAVVLFDEIEKAHPDVANLLLQILDEGYLTDAEGRRVSFRHTLVILTSNIGTASFTQAARIGFHTLKGSTQTFETIERSVLTELKETLRPELLARLDHTLVFQPLTASALTAIALRELRALAARLLTQGIILTWRPTVTKHLASLALVEGSGARSLKKYIVEQIEYHLASELLAHPRPTTLTLSLHHGTIIVRHAR